MWIGYLLAGVLAVASYYTAVHADAPPIVQVTLYCLVSLSASAAVLYGCLRNGPRRPLPWILLGLSQLVYAVADCNFYVAHFVLGDGTFPAVADVFYLGHYPLVVAGLLVFIRRRSPGGDLPAVLDAAVLAVVAAMLSWLYLIAPQEDAGSPTMVLLASVGYPVMDLAVFAVAIRLILGPGRRSVPFVLLSTNLLAFLAADTTYVSQQLNGTYGAGNFLDAFWLFGNLALGAAALHPTMGTVDEPRPATGDVPGPGAARIAALCLASLIAPATLIVQHYTGSRENTPVIAVACAVLFVLTVVRMAGLVAEQRRLAITDSLTGLYTRRYLEGRLPQALHDARRRGTSAALLIADIDRFKAVNDNYGHPAGDAVLIEVARRLRAVTRGGDLLARFGGEEFAVLIPGAGGDDPGVIGERLRRRVAESPVPLPAGGHVRVTISVGTSSFPLHGTTQLDLIAAADRALYAAKEQGRDRLVQGGAVHGTQTAGPGPAVLEPLDSTALDAAPDLSTLDSALDLTALADRVDAWVSPHEHSSAVGRWSGLLARRLGLDAETVRRSALAGRLHDVGKALTDEEIWRKTGRLSEAERGQVRLHPEHGWRLTRTVPGLAEVAEVIRQHHERLDGHGYPDGLTGAAIRIEARIVAVCDCWAAMVAERVYRAALSEEQARDELLAGRDQGYDPAVVDAFLALWQEGSLGTLRRLEALR